MSENSVEDRLQLVAASRGGRGRSAPPFIISRCGHLRPLAHLDDREVSLPRVDALELCAHRDSWAKKAAAFPKNSAFILSSRFSFSNSLRRARSVIDSGGSSPA